MIDLQNHAALVTGSSKGIGRSIAVSFAKAGADVLVHGRQRSDDSNEVIDQCIAEGVDSDFVAGDLSGPTEEAVKQVFEKAIELNPRVDILVNNAGQYFDVEYLDMTIERLEKTLRLNVMSGYFLTQLFAKHWIENEINGRVLFVGSINGELAEPCSTGYDTSKGAVAMMVKTLAVALAPKGIRVNGMAPGLVQTPQTAWIKERVDDAAWMAHHTPNKQVPHSDVCGPGCVYLCSDLAEHVHGQMLMIDGGMSSWQHPHRDEWQK